MQAVHREVGIQIEFLLEELKRSAKSNVGAGLVPARNMERPQGNHKSLQNQPNVGSGLVPALHTDRQNWATTRIAPTYR